MNPKSEVKKGTDKKLFLAMRAVNCSDTYFSCSKLYF